MALVGIPYTLIPTALNAEAGDETIVVRGGVAYRAPYAEYVGDAQAYAAAALLSEQKAEAWAVAAENIPVETGPDRFSAQHHSIKASVSAAASANDAASASSHAAAANTSLLALGDALLNVLGAFSIDANGDLIVSYNSAAITGIEIDAAGDLIMTYVE
jgi:hypothetical protein